MKFSTLALASVVALGFSGAAFAQDEPGFGGHGTVSKNQQPGPSVNNATDPAAGNPNSPAQTPTDPVKQQDLQWCLWSWPGRNWKPSASLASTSVDLPAPGARTGPRGQNPNAFRAYHALRFKLRL